MINSQQIVVNLPLIDKMKFPANAMMVNEFIVDFVTFDLIPVDWLDQKIHYWPDFDPFSLNFESAGIVSIFYLSNVGIALHMMELNILMALIYACLKTKKKTSCRSIEKLKIKLKEYLYFL